MTFSLLTFDIQAALERLSDPEKTVSRPLVKGAAAGTWNLIYSLFPPGDSTTSRESVQFTLIHDAWVTSKLSVLPRLFEEGSLGRNLVVGYADGFFERTTHETRGLDHLLKFVAVKYVPSLREGDIYLSKELANALENSVRAELNLLKEQRDKGWPIRRLGTN